MSKIALSLVSLYLDVMRGALVICGFSGMLCVDNLCASVLRSLAQGAEVKVAEAAQYQRVCFSAGHVIMIHYSP